MILYIAKCNKIVKIEYICQTSYGSLVAARFGLMSVKKRNERFLSSLFSLIEDNDPVEPNDEEVWVNVGPGVYSCDPFSNTSLVIVL